LKEGFLPYQGVSGRIFKCHGLDAVLASLKPGDTLFVWKLDRLGRSLAHLVQTVSDLGEPGSTGRRDKSALGAHFGRRSTLRLLLVARG